MSANLLPELGNVMEMETRFKAKLREEDFNPKGIVRPGKSFNKNLGEMYGKILRYQERKHIRSG